MREVLLDLLKQTNGLTEDLRITGTDKETVIKGCDKDKTLFIEATLKTPLQEFEGDFGLTNMKLLDGLLNFSNYQTNDASFSVKKRVRDGVAFIEQFEFRNKVTGNDADFRMMDPKHLPTQATIPNTIPWDIVFVPSKAKIAEFQQLAKLYAEVDSLFGARVVGDNLQFSIGDENSSSHRVSMIFEPKVSGTLKGKLQWNTNQFLSIMKLSGSHPTTMKITNRAVISIVVETPYGIYNYYLRAHQS